MAALRGALQARPAETEARYDIVPQQAVAPAEGLGTYLLSVPTSNGFVLVERQGAVPELGTEVELPDQPGVKFVVAKVAAQPLTGRPCAYLQQA